MLAVLMCSQPSSSQRRRSLRKMSFRMARASLPHSSSRGIDKSSTSHVGAAAGNRTRMTIPSSVFVVVTLFIGRIVVGVTIYASCPTTALVAGFDDVFSLPLADKFDIAGGTKFPLTNDLDLCRMPVSVVVVVADVVVDDRFARDGLNDGGRRAGDLDGFAGVAGHAVVVVATGGGDFHDAIAVGIVLAPERRGEEDHFIVQDNRHFCGNLCRCLSGIRGVASTRDSEYRYLVTFVCFLSILDISDG
jgi:hypothetical protein